MANDAKVLRCAIYTRKSTEHGLEQEFNSLDAQREACEAYIKSQASQGWKALPQQYDDPALLRRQPGAPCPQRLLADIEAGKVDVVVVYKIDRLTRSLADFAKLVEAFDAKSISFVAVTQQFNTTTSMGRLTLNVLLSFAQFERELSSERVRDKVAASRRKGKWTGGTVPLGYDAKDKKLVINKSEAETVRTIFRALSGAGIVQQAGRRTRPPKDRHQTPQHQGRKVSGRHTLHLRSPRLSPEEPDLYRRDPPRRQMVQGRARSDPGPRDVRPSAGTAQIQHRQAQGQVFRKRRPASGQALRRQGQPHEPELFQQERRALSLLRQHRAAGPKAQGRLGHPNFGAGNRRSRRGRAQSKSSNGPNEEMLDQVETITVSDGPDSIGAEAIKGKTRLD